MSRTLRCECAETKHRFCPVSQALARLLRARRLRSQARCRRAGANLTSRCSRRTSCADTPTRHGTLRTPALGRRRRGAGVEEGLLLDWQKRGEEAQQLSSERMPLLQDLGPGSPRLPRLGQDLEHQIFSRLTRNALNSGVRALASPTKGVSALA